MKNLCSPADREREPHPSRHERLTQSEQTITELADFRTQALARLATQHEEIVRLREAAAGTCRVSRLPAPQPQ
ncbi:hypothetical protein ABZT48_44980 [Streptomyces avermitilis]|uniref:hypothetical protein n=1 Tax=Streptomyces avermitilis TaxID=33903 RepID=UPI0033AFAEBC